MKRPTLEELNASTDGLTRIFVYGTLKQGFGNWKNFLAGSKHVGMAKTEGIMFHSGGFPAISFEEKFSPIIGEVYDVNRETLRDLDFLEGIPTHYNRVNIRLNVYGDCYTYIYPHERAAAQRFVIPSGNWQGPQTGKLQWLGFGKGVLIGDGNDPISLLSTLVDPKFILRPDTENTGKCYMVDRSSGTIIGTYRSVQDFLESKKSNPAAKPRIVLGAKHTQQSPQLPAVLQNPAIEAAARNLPVIITAPAIAPLVVKEPLVGPGIRMA